MHNDEQFTLPDEFGACHCIMYALAKGREVVELYHGEHGNYEWMRVAIECFVVSYKMYTPFVAVDNSTV